MSTSIKKSSTEQRASVALVNWSDPKMQIQIKEAYGKNLNENEWKLFLGLGIATGLNPFLREIWAVKYGSSPASIFIGRDGYRRSAQAHPEYEYHYCDAVYSNDTFEHQAGEVTHKYNLKNRGDLVGAYCVVKRKGSSRPVVNYIATSEYDTHQSVWNTKKASMSKKVAEAQGLRASFQELFAGTYDESESVEKNTRNIVMDVPSPEELIAKLEAAKTKEEYETIAQDVAKDMGYLTEDARDKVTKVGKKLRAKFNKTKEETDIKVTPMEKDSDNKACSMQELAKEAFGNNSLPLK